MDLLNELKRIKSVMGVIDEEEKSYDSMNLNLAKTVEVLKQLKLYTKTVEKMLIEISKLSKEQIIDFGLLERGLRKVLLSKGDKKKTVANYFGNIISSLKFRERNSTYGTEPEAEDYEFDSEEESSLVPKKVYKKEMFELQVELLILQEW